MNNEGKEGGFLAIFIIMAVSVLIAIFWHSIPFVKDFIDGILTPTAGAILNWNMTWGMIFIVLIISIFTTIIQKYATDQATLKELRKEQKRLQKEMRAVEANPGKLLELQKESAKLMGPMFKLSMRPAVYTSIPLILFFRWFSDFFAATGSPVFFGFLNWFWFYLIFAIIFSSILRKVFDVA